MILSFIAAFRAEVNIIRACAYERPPDARCGVFLIDLSLQRCRLRGSAGRGSRAAGTDRNHAR
jgi:hypothetical protein